MNQLEIDLIISQNERLKKQNADLQQEVINLKEELKKYVS